MISRRKILAGLTTAVSAAAPGKKKPTTPDTAAGVPLHLLCEYLANPLGIDELEPRLSWEIQATVPNARGVRQTAYQIMVATHPDLLNAATPDLWDSGRVESGQSVHLPYAGKPLRSRMQCHWKVRIWDERAKVSAWSEPALWTMGLLSADDWSGSWIGLDEPAGKPEPWFPGALWIWYPERNPRVDAAVGVCYFQREFDLPKGRSVVAADLYVNADSQCSASLNGKPAGEGGPVRTGTTDIWKKPQPLDVRSMLQPGSNVLTVVAENAGGPKQNPAGLIGLLRVKFDDGLEWTLVTDRQWRVSRDAAATPTLSAMELGAFGIAPWNNVRPENYTTLPARMLRREIDIPRRLRRAMAYVCGLGYCDLYLNGQRVGDHIMTPVMSDYQKKIHYITFDVTSHLRQGPNAVGMLLGNGPFFAYRQKVAFPEFRTFGYPKALLNIRLEYDDGSFEDVVTDPDWKITTEGPLRANNEYDGEIYDARREQTGWSEPGFDDAAWRRVQLVDHPGGNLRAQMLEPQRVTETLRPVAITEPRPGVFVVDFGQVFNGWVRLKVSGPAGAEVHLRRGGILRANGTVREVDSRSALLTDVYILSGRGTETWTARFTSQGGRYVQVTGFPGRASPENFDGLVVHTDMPAVGSFECSNQLITRLYHVMRWSQRIEARGVPLDCASRDERMPWISEHHGLEGHGYPFRAAAMYAHWLEDLRLSQRADGSIPNVAPSFWTFGRGVVWPVTLIYLPHWLHLFYGDRRAVERSYPSMKRLVRFISDTYLKSDGTIDYNDHGDWLDTSTIDNGGPTSGATPQPLISSAFFYFYCTILERSARLLGRGADARDFAVLGERVRAGFNRRFFDPAANAYAGGTQTSYVLPLAFGLVPAERRAAVARNLADDVLVKHNGHTTCGFMGVQWILTVLSETGHHDAAYSIMTRTARPSWGYMVDKGATTMWERWDHDTADPSMTGESQYFLGADIVGWLFRSLGGINSDPDHPGFQRLILRPRLAAGLRWVKTSFGSLYGPIASEWKVAGARFDWTVSVPPNCTALAFVPAGDPKRVTESGQPAEGSAGIRFVRAEDGAAVYELSSGVYHFSSGLP
jgi:alpha-L-rhamnosidase